MKKIIKRISFIGLMLITASSGAAVTIIDHLSMGIIAITNNTTTSDITVSSTGRTTITNHIRVLGPGHPAEFLLSSYPPYTQLFTTTSVVVAVTSSNTGPSEQFTLVAVETAPSVTTDGTGVAAVKVGGTLRTSGSGTGQYFDTLYTATLELSVNF